MCWFVGVIGREVRVAAGQRRVGVCAVGGLVEGGGGGRAVTGGGFGGDGRNMVRASPASFVALCALVEAARGGGRIAQPAIRAANVGQRGR
eukprot:COSAG02_NODE_10146_length_2010_cov_28.166405_2_plen_91_part_00